MWSYGAVFCGAVLWSSVERFCGVLWSDSVEFCGAVQWSYVSGSVELWRGYVEQFCGVLAEVLAEVLYYMHAPSLPAARPRTASLAAVGPIPKP